MKFFSFTDHLPTVSNSRENSRALSSEYGPGPPQRDHDPYTKKFKTLPICHCNVVVIQHERAHALIEFYMQFQKIIFPSRGDISYFALTCYPSKICLFSASFLFLHTINDHLTSFTRYMVAQEGTFGAILAENDEILV